MAESIIGVDFDYTYQGQLITEVMMKPSENTPAISDLFTIRQGFKYKQRIPLLLPLEKIVKAYTSCGRTFTDGVNITNTTLELEALEVNMEWCKDDFEGEVGNILAETLMRSGIDEFDPSGTEIQTLIDELISDGIRRDTFRLISFGDKNDADANWNQINGLWTQLLAADGAGASYCVQKGASLGTGDLEEGEALEALRAVYQNSEVILKQLPNDRKYFAVTGSVYENLLSSYEANTNGTERQFTMLTNGVDGLSFRGIVVLPIYAWDLALADPTNPLYGTVEHLILYTTKLNQAVGMDVAADAERINGWYERKDRKYYVEGYYRLGYTYLHCDLQTIAY